LTADPVDDRRQAITSRASVRIAWSHSPNECHLVKDDAVSAVRISPAMVPAVLQTIQVPHSKHCSY
jgi:hypothetical protein